MEKYSNLIISLLFLNMYNLSAINYNCLQTKNNIIKGAGSKKWTFLHISNICQTEMYNVQNRRHVQGQGKLYHCLVLKGFYYLTNVTDGRY